MLLHSRNQGPFEIEEDFQNWEVAVVTQGGRLQHEESFPCGTELYRTSFYTFKDGEEETWMYLRQGMSEPCHSQMPAYLEGMKGGAAC